MNSIVMQAKSHWTQTPDHGGEFLTAAACLAIGKHFGVRDYMLAEAIGVVVVAIDGSGEVRVHIAGSELSPGSLE